MQTYNSEAAVVADQLVKTYNKGRTRAADQVSFRVAPGELFGLIGPDGAGKTSIFRMLTTLLLPDSGTATVSGLDIVQDYKQIRRTVGYMPGTFSLYQDLTVQENLDFFATVFQTTVAANYHLIQDIYVQLSPFKNRRAGQLSGGMKQKLALCCALIHKPEVLFLDEPTTGVDPVSRKEFWDMLQQLKAQGITIIVSTPYMDEAARCDRIALIQNGRILSVDTPEQLINTYPYHLYTVQPGNMYRFLQAVKAYQPVRYAYASGERACMVCDRELDRENFGQFMTQQQQPFSDLQAATPTIEDRFIQLLQH